MGMAILREKFFEIHRYSLRPPLNMPVMISLLTELAQTIALLQFQKKSIWLVRGVYNTEFC